MVKIYIETSAANYFINELNGEGAEATRSLQLSKGRDWYISTTVLWELLQINDKKDLDACLYLASFLFNNRLLKSAAEIFIEYTEKGCPSYLLLDSPFTNATIGEYWSRACADKSYSFYINDPNFIEITSHLKKIAKCMRYITHDRTHRPLVADEEIDSLTLLIDTLYQDQLKDANSNQTTIWLRKIAILLLFIQICLCIDISRDAIIKFWESKNLSDPFDRLDFILNTYPDVLRIGPLWNVANAILIQCTKKGRSSQSAFHDGLHAIYLPFVDIFLTKDNHFRKMRDMALKEFKDTLYNKIYHIDEISLTRVSST